MEVRQFEERKMSAAARFRQSATVAAVDPMEEDDAGYIAAPLAAATAGPMVVTSSAGAASSVRSAGSSHMDISVTGPLGGGTAGSVRGRDTYSRRASTVPGSPGLGPLDSHKPAKQHVKYRRTKNGETIYKGHPSYDLMVNIKLGIRYVIGKVSATSSRELLLPAFRESYKQFFPSGGTSETPAHSASDFKWKDYAPQAFRHFRELFQIDAGDFMLSLCGDHALRELPTPGKSGAVFYISSNDMFIIKTISKRESKFLRQILPNYYMHLMQNPNVLLPRFFGHYRVKTNKGRKIRLVVMNNILNTTLSISERYDLKGSTFGRYTEEKKKENPNITMKDLDFVHIHEGIQLGPAGEKFIRQLSADAAFLESLQIMDYSLFFGLHYVTDDVDDALHDDVPSMELDDESDMPSSAESRRNMFQQNNGGIHGRSIRLEKNVICYFGIIDILQQYNVKKQVEHSFKVLKYSQDRTSISAIDPPHYCQRFSRFLASCFPKG